MCPCWSSSVRASDRLLQRREHAFSQGGQALNLAPILVFVPINAPTSCLVNRSAGLAVSVIAGDLSPPLNDLGESVAEHISQRCQLRLLHVVQGRRHVSKGLDRRRYLIDGIVRKADCDPLELVPYSDHGPQTRAEAASIVDSLCDCGRMVLMLALPLAVDERQDLGAELSQEPAEYAAGEHCQQPMPVDSQPTPEIARHIRSGRRGRSQQEDR